MKSTLNTPLPPPAVVAAAAAQSKVSPSSVSASTVVKSVVAGDDGKSNAKDLAASGTATALMKDEGAERVVSAPKRQKTD